MDVEIRKATSDDRDAVWRIIQPIILAGDTYAFAPDTPKQEMLEYWFGEASHTYVAVLDGSVVGTFVIKPNQPGLGSHIANAGYMTAAEASGKGIGTLMGRFSIEEAKRLGFEAMQFNLVVKSNQVAVRIWQKIGFEIIGEIPDAFRHKKLGLTNAYIMYRKL